MANLGVPVKLLHESLGHIVTVELKTGEVSGGSKILISTLTHRGYIVWLTAQMYRGKLMEGDPPLLASLCALTYS